MEEDQATLIRVLFTETKQEKLGITIEYFAHQQTFDQYCLAV